MKEALPLTERIPMHQPMTAEYARRLRRESVKARDTAHNRGWMEWREAFDKRVDSLDTIIADAVGREREPETGKE